MASRLREVILLLYSALCPVVKCCVQCSAHQEKRDVATLQLGKEKAQRDLNKDYKFLEGGCKDDRASVFSLLPSDRTRGNGHRTQDVAS